MSPVEPKLANLRREIDLIDDSIHDLIMRRIALVGSIRTAKAGAAAWRPAREAAILRRLIARHSGLFPPLALTRMWREMMAATTRLQGPFAVAVCLPADKPGYWDLARGHFGATVDIQVHHAARGAVAAVREGAATVGIVPMPEDGEARPWWPDLDDDLRIAARLPFAPSAVRGAVEGLAIAKVLQEPSGDDHSFVILETTEGMSRTRLTSALKAAGLPVVALYRRGKPPVFLAEIADFVAEDDARLDSLAGISARAVGGFAVPLKLPRKK